MRVSTIHMNKLNENRNKRTQKISPDMLTTNISALPFWKLISGNLERSIHFISWIILQNETQTNSRRFDFNWFQRLCDLCMYKFFFHWFSRTVWTVYCNIMWKWCHPFDKYGHVCRSWLFRFYTHFSTTFNAPSFMTAFSYAWIS